jgi:hypothetical protein
MAYERSARRDCARPRHDTPFARYDGYVKAMEANTKPRGGPAAGAAS